MTTIEEKKMQLELSSKIAKKLIEAGLSEIDSITQEKVFELTGEDYILSLKKESDLDYKKWDMFFTLLKFDFAYQLRIRK